MLRALYTFATRDGILNLFFQMQISKSNAEWNVGQVSSLSGLGFLLLSCAKQPTPPPDSGSTMPSLQNQSKFQVGSYRQQQPLRVRD
jgi:hypothetical protein